MIDLVAVGIREVFRDVVVPVVISAIAGYAMIKAAHPPERAYNGPPDPPRKPNDDCCCGCNCRHCRADADKLACGASKPQEDKPGAPVGSPGV